MPRQRVAPRFHAVLLAGGSGTRFWPLSRMSRPKQFLPLAERETLLEATWKRALALAPRDRVWVVAPARLVADVRRALPALRRDRIVVEPSPRDTAPAIALACMTIVRAEPRAVVGIFPTDHVIRDVRRFVTAVRAASRTAASGALVCLGIRPDRPATGFGYLRCARPARGPRAVPVERFVEKPDEATARRFLRTGRYLWNGGMFVWRAGRFLQELERTAPGVHDAVARTVAGKKRAWLDAERKSVDYAVMEKASDVQVVPLDAGWDDVGSWDAAARLREEAGLAGESGILVDSPGAVVFGSRRLVALVGVPRVVVVDTPDAILVVSRDRSERVRRVVEEVRARGREDLL